MASPLDRMLDLLDRAEQLADRNPWPERKARATGVKAKPRDSIYHQGDDAKKQLRVMQRALAIIRDGGWTQHNIAVTADGQNCTADSPDAVAWCLDGAIQKATYEHSRAGSASSSNRIARVCRRVLQASGIDGSGELNAVIQLAKLNDETLTTKEEAIAILEKAIAEQKQRVLGR